MDHNAAIDVIDNDGETPLMKAARRNILPIVIVLVDRGCNIFELSSKKRSAYDLAITDSLVKQYLHNLMMTKDHLVETTIIIPSNYGSNENADDVIFK